MLITSKEIDIAFKRGYEARVAEEKQERDTSIRDAIADADLDPRFTTPPKDTGGKLSGEVAGLIEYSETQAMLEGRANASDVSQLIGEPGPLRANRRQQ